MTPEPLTDDQIISRLAAVSWRRDGSSLVRETELENFNAALQLLNRVAALADARNHHPDMLLHSWNKLRLTLSTHDAGGLTARDFELATEIDRLMEGDRSHGG